MTLPAEGLTGLSRSRRWRCFASIHVAVWQFPASTAYYAQPLYHHFCFGSIHLGGLLRAQAWVYKNYREFSQQPSALMLTNQHKNLIEQPTSYFIHDLLTSVPVLTHFLIGWFLYPYLDLRLQ